MTGAAPAAPAPLRPSLGLSGVLALTLAALSPAASVFVTGAAILHLAGTGAAIAVLGGGAAVMVATLLYAELGAAYPHAGGVYHGIGEVLGRPAAAAVLALGLVTAPALLAFVSLGLAAYVRALGVAASPLVVADGAVVLAVGVAALRLRAGLWLTGALLAAELAVLAATSAMVWWRPARALGTVLLHPVTLAPNGALAAPGVVPLMLATIAAAYACSGSNLALNFAEEIRGDRAGIGRAVLWGGVLSIGLVAVPLTGVSVGTPHLAAVLSDEAPIAAVVRIVAGVPAARLLAAVVALAILDHISGAVIAYSRFVFAAARSLGRAAALFASLDGRTGAPVAAACALGAVTIGLTLLGERSLLLLVSGELVTPALMATAVLVGRRRGQTGRTSFRSPLYPVLPGIGLAILAVFGAADLLDTAARRSLLLLIAVAIATALLTRRAR